MKQTLALLLLFISNTILAQPNFQNISFQEALEKANTEGKLLFLQFEAASCNQCNEVANKGLTNAAVAKRINEAFVPLLISINHPDRAYIGQQYNISNGMGTLFINASKTLIHAYRKTTTRSSEYSNQINIALEKAGESLKINELETVYNKGNKSPGLLEALLLKKRSLSLPTETLLDEYVTSLPADSLTSTRTLQFIAQMAPILNSNADKALRQDAAAFNKAWYSLQLTLRISINNRIIYKSLTEAINNKNEVFAKQIARFALATHSGSPAGIKAHDKHLLRYYKETGDTVTYFKEAIAFYERYFSKSHADSIKRVDSTNKARLARSAPRDTLREGQKITIRSSFAYSAIAQSYMAELNEGAWSIYKMTDNPSLLSVATGWVTKALDYHETPEVLHTYACLLYKLGHKQQALVAINNAIALKKKGGYATTEWEVLQDKMKKGSPIS